MPQPPAYTRTSNLVELATANPAAPYQPAAIDGEFNNIVATLSQTLANLALIQRDDGGLANSVVSVDSLDPSVLTLIGSAGFTIANPVVWNIGVNYPARQIVDSGSGGTYVSVVAHTSGATFGADLLLGRWALLYSTTAVAAASVAFTPTGTIAAGNVQAALAEVASEAMQKSANLSDVSNVATARSNLGAAATDQPSLLTRATIISSDPGPAEGPELLLDRASASPAAGDDLGSVTYRGRNLLGSSIDFAKIAGELVDPTTGSEDGEIKFSTRVAGTLIERFVLGHGLFSFGTVDPGGGNINVAGGYYVNSVPIINTPASQAEQETASALDRIVTPARQQFHPSAAKAWCVFNGTGTIANRAAYNCGSPTDNGNGDYTINFTTPFSSANYAASLTVGRGASGSDVRLAQGPSTADPTASAYRVLLYNNLFVAGDAEWVSLAFFGDQ